MKLKLFSIAAGAAAGLYVLFFSDAAKRQSASELMGRGLTPACEAPQVEEMAQRVLRRSWAADSIVSVNQEVSARHNQRTCWAKVASETQGLISGHAEFTVEYDPQGGILFVIFADNSLAFEGRPLSK